MAQVVPSRVDLQTGEISNRYEFVHHFRSSPTFLFIWLLSCSVPVHLDMHCGACKQVGILAALQATCNPVYSLASEPAPLSPTDLLEPECPEHQGVSSQLCAGSLSRASKCARQPQEGRGRQERCGQRTLGGSHQLSAAPFALRGSTTRPPGPSSVAQILGKPFHTVMWLAKSPFWPLLTLNWSP